jgi:hypothetical protein
MRKESVFTRGFDVQCPRPCFHQYFEVIIPEVHEDLGFHYAPSVQVYGH